jgi:hypothetical protein
LEQSQSRLIALQLFPLAAFGKTSVRILQRFKQVFFHCNRAREQRFRRHSSQKDTHPCHIPAIYESREFAVDGGLTSYGASVRRGRGGQPPSHLRALLRCPSVPSPSRGTRDSRQPTKFDLLINLKTAKALGLTIPESFLLRADKVFE